MDQFDSWTAMARDWRVRILHRLAQAFGILIKIDGMPWGSLRLKRSRGWPGAGDSGSVGP
jgi:hypothetical protein